MIEKEIKIVRKFDALTEHIANTCFYNTKTFLPQGGKYDELEDKSLLYDQSQTYAEELQVGVVVVITGWCCCSYYRLVLL